MCVCVFSENGDLRITVDMHDHPGEDRWSDVGGRPQEDGQCVGLVPGHAYTVLQAKEPRPGIRLLCIRNPWGSFEW